MILSFKFVLSVMSVGKWVEDIGRRVGVEDKEMISFMMIVLSLMCLRDI